MSAECSAGSVQPGYKQTEVGVIPDDWEIHTIGNSMCLINGRAFKPEDWKDHGLPIIRIQNLNDTEISFNYFSGYVEDRHLIEADDLLFAWSGTTGTSFGARIWKGPTGVLNQHIFKVIPDQKKLTSSYAFLVLRKVQEAIEKQAHGFKASFVHVKKTDLVSVQLPLPPTKKEQKAIAEALSDADAFIKSLEQLIVKKRQIKQGAMQELLTGKRRLPGFEIKNGYKQTEIGMIPEDWNLDCIENLAHITTGGKNTQDRVDEGQYPFFVRSQKIERINSYSYDGEAVLTAGDGVGTGKVFHYIKGKFDVHQRVYLISEFDPQIDGYYFFLYFSNHFYNRIMQMTAKSSVDSVRRETISRMLVPLPPLHEQTAISAILSDMDSEITALEEKLAKARQLKQGMMQELLTGRIRLL